MIQKEPIVYTDQETNEAYEGVLAWDDSTDRKRPGVLVSHTFRGQGDFETNKAIELAKMGYVGFALDMYGKGRRAKEKEEADALMNELLEDRPMLLKRIRLAVQTLMSQELVDESKIGGIGFCFGGKCMLDLARSGDDLAGVVSFHGIYDQPGINHEGDIKASVLVLHGWEDPLANPESTVALGQELTERNADWQILAFGHTGHAFTNPSVNMKAEGFYYQESASNRAWQAMSNFLKEVLGDVTNSNEIKNDVNTQTKLIDRSNENALEKGESKMTNEDLFQREFHLLIEHPEVKHLIEKSAALSKKRMSAEEFIKKMDFMLSLFVDFSLASLVEIVVPLYEKLGVKTGKSKEITFDQSVQEVLVKTMCSLVKHDFALKEVHSANNGFVLLADIPSDYKTWGGDLALEIEQKESKVRVNISTKIRGQIVDWGKSKSVIKNILSDIEQVGLDIDPQKFPLTLSQKN